MRAAHRKQKTGRGPALAHRYVLVGLYLIVVIGPAFALLTDVASIPIADWLRLAAPSARQARLWIRSVALAGAVAVAGMTLGLLVALALQRWREGRLVELRWAFLLLAPLPPVTHAMAWSWVTGRLNRTMAQRGLRPMLLQGWVAAWWVQVVWLLPIAIGLAWIALSAVDTRMVEAARLLQPDARALRRVILPLAAPLLLAGGGILFLLSLVDYTIPSLCQINVTALDIFADFSVHNRPGRALLVSLPLLVTTAGVLTFSQARLRPAALAPSWHRAPAGVLPLWPPALRAAIRISLLVLLLAASVPLISLVTQVEGGRELALTLTEARSEIGTSLLIAALTGVLSLPLGYGAAVAAHAQSHAGWMAITLPLALPGPLVGIGLITLWNRPGWARLGLPLYGSAWMPVLATLARYTPIAALILVATLRRINPRLIEAAAMLETKRIRTWILIRLPMLAPGLLAAAGVVFALTLGELSATLLVSAPGRPTLTMRIYNYLHYGASETVAGLTLVLSGLVIVFGLLVGLGLILWSRLTSMAATAASTPARPVAAPFHKGEPDE